MADGVLITQGTQTTIATDDVSGTQYQVVKLDVGGNGLASPFTGTLAAVTNLAAGTITRVEGGSIVVTSIPNVPGGTIGVVSSITTIPNIPGGTIGVVSSLANLAAGTVTRLEQGSINVTAGTVVVTTIPNTPGGTLGLVTTVSNVSAGSINVIAGTIGAGTVGGKAASGAAASGNPVFIGGTDPGGTVYGFRTDTNGVLQVNGTVSTGGAGTQDTRLIDGTLTRLEQGSINVTAGTVVVTSLPDLPGGTVDSITDVANLAKGTITRVEGGTVGLVTRVGNVGTVEVGTISAMPNIPGGTIGLVSAITNLAAGTVTRLEQGSVNVTSGTFSLRNKPVTNVSAYGTALAGTATTALVSAPGVGTSIYINDFSVTNQGTAAIEAMVAFGTFETGANVLFRGFIGASGGGIQKSFSLPVNAGLTNTALNAKVLSTGTCNFNVTYWVE